MTTIAMQCIVMNSNDDEKMDTLVQQKLRQCQIGGVGMMVMIMMITMIIIVVMMIMRMMIIIMIIMW